MTLVTAVAVVVVICFVSAGARHYLSHQARISFTEDTPQHPSLYFPSSAQLSHTAPAGRYITVPFDVLSAGGSGMGSVQVLAGASPAQQLMSFQYTTQRAAEGFSVGFFVPRSGTPFHLEVALPSQGLLIFWTATSRA